MKNNNLKYAILGASGYIGKYLSKTLLENGNYTEIYLICRESSVEKYNQIFKKYTNNKLFIIAESSPKIPEIYASVDVLINLASSRANETDEAIFNSILFQYNQVKKIEKAHIPTVINISSQSVYNQKEDIRKKESDSVCINNLYAYQKYAIEQYFNHIEYSETPNSIINLRFSRVFGLDFEKTNPEGFFIKIIESVLNNNKITIPNPLNKINLLDINDAVNAILYFISLSQQEIVRDTINIGGENFSMLEYCELVKNTLSVSANPIKLSDSKLIETSSLIDCSLAKKYGWENKITIKESIKVISDYFINN